MVDVAQKGAENTEIHTPRTPLGAWLGEETPMSRTLARRRSVALATIGALALAGTLAACGSSAPDGTVRPAAAESASAASAAATDGSASPGTDLNVPSPTGSLRGHHGGSGTETLLSEVRVTAQEAAAKAEGQAPDATVVGIELDREHSRVAWEVKLVGRNNIHEVYVDAANGRVLAAKLKHDSRDHGEARSRVSRTKIAFDAAVRTAEAKLPGARVVEIELDDDHGALVWELHLLSSGPTKHEVKIDAVTGALR